VSLRIIFFGTPEVARVSLAALVEEDLAPVAVVSQPDRPAGRGRRLQPPPVKVEALARGLEVLQPEKIKDEAFLARLAGLRPDALVTVAYGRILPAGLLELPRLKPLNLHFSLLPAYRGAAPVAWALINGETSTGLSVIEMVPRLDAGPILAQEEVAIEPGETAGQLGLRLAERGARLLIETLRDLAAGRLEPRDQDESRASYAPPLKPEDGRLDFGQPARALECRGRGVTPWPGARVGFGDLTLKLSGFASDQAQPEAEPGRVVGLGPLGYKIACGRGHLYAAQVQHPGKKPQAARQAAGGAGPRVGDWLG